MIRAELSPRSDVGRIVVSVDTDHAEPHELWWETTEGEPPPVPGRLDAVAVALVAKAMNFRQDLHLDGPVSWSVLANLEEFVDAWSTWRPDLFGRVAIGASEVVDDRGDGPGALADRTVLACSGGVDSTYALYAHTRGTLGRRACDVAAALFVHGFDIAADDRIGGARALEAVSAIAGAVSVPVVALRTNWRQVADPDWEMTFGTALAACLLLFDDRAGVATLAADSSYTRLTIPWGSNAVTQPLLGAARQRVAYVGGGATRTAKCAAIGAEAVVRRHLRVCWEGPDPGRNCGVCEKCQRTKVNFAAAGVGTIEALGPIDVEQLAEVVPRSVTARDLYRELAGETDGLDPEIIRQVRRIADTDLPS